jgi:hypothetical protein
MFILYDNERLQMNDGLRYSAVVVHEIEEAFRDVTYPGDGCLTKGYSSEAFHIINIANWLKGRRWQDLPLEELVRSHESLFFMTPQAIQYYLPAFLLASVLHYHEADPVPSTVLFFLTFPKNDEDRSRFRDQFHLFTKSQGDSIRAFLEFIRDKYPEDYVQGNEIREMLGWWSGNWIEDLGPHDRLTANRRSGFLTLVGSGLATASILGLGITLWLFRFNPSHWFVMIGDRPGYDLSGWTIIVALLFMLSVGLFLVALARKRKRQRDPTPR